MKWQHWLILGILAVLPLTGCGQSEPVAPPVDVQEADTTEQPPEVELGEPEESN